MVVIRMLLLIIISSNARPVHQLAGGYGDDEKVLQALAFLRSVQGESPRFRAAPGPAPESAPEPAPGPVPGPAPGAVDDNADLVATGNEIMVPAPGPALAPVPAPAQGPIDDSVDSLGANESTGSETMVPEGNNGSGDDYGSDYEDGDDAAAADEDTAGDGEAEADGVSAAAATGSEGDAAEGEEAEAEEAEAEGSEIEPELVETPVVRVTSQNSRGACSISCTKTDGCLAFDYKATVCNLHFASIWKEPESFPALRDVLGNLGLASDFCNPQQTRKTCVVPGGQQCKVAGKCVDKTGICSPIIDELDGFICNDQNETTMNDECKNGKCIGIPKNDQSQWGDNNYWCLNECTLHSSCQQRDYSWPYRGRNGTYQHSFHGEACSCHPGYFGDHGLSNEWPALHGACKECGPGETSDYFSRECTKCLPGKYTEVQRTANVDGRQSAPSKNNYPNQTGCINCWPGRYSQAEGMTDCKECVAGRTSGVGSRECLCRRQGSCTGSDLELINSLGGRWPQLSGNNCAKGQADSCTRDHLQSRYLLQHHSDPTLFLEKRLSQFNTANPARPSSKTIEFDCISTVRAFEVTVQLFDSQIDMPTNASLMIRFLDAAGVSQLDLSFTGSSRIFPQFQEDEPTRKNLTSRGRGCDDKGDRLPIDFSAQNKLFIENGTNINYQPCTGAEKWERLTKKWVICILGVKKIEFVCTKNYCNVHSWQWVVGVENTVEPKPLNEGRPLDSYQSW